VQARVKGIGKSPHASIRDRRDIVHEQLDEGVRPGVTLVLGQEQPRPARAIDKNAGQPGAKRCSHSWVNPRRSYQATAAAAFATRRIGMACSSMQGMLP
jgi:hypothetical protein